MGGAVLAGLELMHHRDDRPPFGRGWTLTYLGYQQATSIGCPDRDPHRLPEQVR